MLRGMPIEFRSVRIRSSCVEPGELPAFLGATLRGAFGEVFKRVACLRARPCEACAEPGRCLYGYVFETPVPRDLPGMGAEFAPHPFVLAPSLHADGWRTPEARRTAFKRGDDLSVELTLVGRAIGFLPAFARVFALMGETGFGAERLRFALDAIDVLDVDGRVTFRHDSLSSLVENPVAAANVEDVKRTLPRPPVRRLELRFLTPLRLEVKGKLVSRPDAETLLRAAFRRLSLLTRLHCGREPDVPYAELIERARSVRATHELLEYEERERFSTRKNRHMAMGGMVGRIWLSGDLDAILPWLYLCQHVHLGKGTSFGLGRFRAIDEAAAAHPEAREDCESRALPAHSADA